jgi:hypothetical protein
MPVLVEANSIIVRVAAVRERFKGGWAAFVDDVPNSTLCGDRLTSLIPFPGISAPGHGTTASPSRFKEAFAILETRNGSA